MIVASLEIERELPTWANFPGAFASWLQVAGGVAALGLLIWFISFVAEKKHLQFKGKKLPLSKLLFLALAGCAAFCYVLFLLFISMQGLRSLPKLKPGTEPPPNIPSIYTAEQMSFLTYGGLFALLAVLTPMVTGLLYRMSFRRIGAICRLSVKEAVRGRVIYIFCSMILIFLFAGYFVSFKPEDQIRNYVMVIYVAMTPLFLVTAAFLGSFSIPTDVQKQTIHTIVTKPVEKYEIVLGRFFGYGFLLTVIMAALTLISLLYVLRGVDPRAAEESFKARVPIFASDLSFYGTPNPAKGESVGREWTYRSYIRGKLPGSNEPPQYAVFSFTEAPPHLANRDEPVKLEFSFDIFRTTKGLIDQGVLCTLTVAPGGFGIDEIQRRVELMKAAFTKERDELVARLKAKGADAEELKAKVQQQRRQLQARLSEAYGVYEESGTVLTDYHTQSIEVPASLFQKLREQHALSAASPGPEQSVPPVFRVLVNVNEDPASAAQYIGMAKRDLYVLASELPFWQNFVKMMIGLWCNTMLLLGVAIACSTYMNGIISLLCTMFVLGAGAVVEYIRSLALGAAIGGGPLESANRLFYRLPTAAELEESATTQLTTGVDELYRWMFSYVLNLIPDINRFNLTEYVQEGFNISWSQVLLLDNLFPMVAYLIPWGILAYYLMNSREIANPR